MGTLYSTVILRVSNTYKYLLMRPGCCAESSWYPYLAERGSSSLYVVVQPIGSNSNMPGYLRSLTSAALLASFGSLFSSGKLHIPSNVQVQSMS